ncbi:MAG: AAA family ATPase [Dehalococcoidia bacterium]
MTHALEPWQLHIIGPQAVGKMTVGQALSRLTAAPLFHNHQVIDLLTEYFPFGTPPFNRLVEDVRRGVIEEAAGAGLNLVVTGALPFDDRYWLAILERWTASVQSRGGQAYFVELRAPLDVRLERNRHEHRRAHKKTDWATDEALRALSEEHRWYSDGDFPWPERHLVIDNTSVTPEEAARRIVEHFGLGALG